MYGENTTEYCWVSRFMGEMVREFIISLENGLDLTYKFKNLKAFPHIEKIRRSFNSCTCYKNHILKMFKIPRREDADLRDRFHHFLFLGIPT